MITEQELELALELNKQIKELNVLIAKLEESKISTNSALNSTVSVDGNKIDVDNYTQDLLQRFKEDIVRVHKIRLQSLKEQYKEIIESPGDALMRILREDD